MTQVEDGSSGINPLPSADEVFVLAKVLNTKQALAVVPSFQPFNTIPSTFMALCRVNLGFDEALKEIVWKEDSRIINDIAYQERSLLRGRKKRPWSRHTRGPFRGIAGEEGISFKERLALAAEVVEKLGVPDSMKKRGRRGRKRVYSMRKLIAAVIAKGTLSFVDLATRLKESSYDAGISSSPSKSTLFNVFTSLPEDYLNSALRMLDRMTADLYRKFGEKLDVFAGDNSAVACDNLIEREIKMKDRLVRDVSNYFALVRITTNTILFISDHTNKISDVAGMIPEGSELLMDAEYDVDENYFLAKEHGIQLTVKPRNVPPNSAIRREYVNSFDKRKYGRRKLAERPFGNITKRRTRSYYRSSESRIKGTTLVAILHDMIAYYRSQRWTGLFL